MKQKMLIAVLTVGIVGAFVLNVFAYRNYSDDQVMYDAKKIGNGVQYTITSDNPDIVADLQRDLEQKDGDGYCPGYRGGRMMGGDRPHYRLFRR